MKTETKQHFNGQSKHLPQEFEDSLKALERTLSEKFPFGIPRKEIGRATGNLLHPRTCANLDCIGQGISGRYKCGRNTIYPVKNAISYIQAKIVVVPNLDEPEPKRFSDSLAKITRKSEIRI